METSPVDLGSGCGSGLRFPWEEDRNTSGGLTFLFVWLGCDR